MPNPLLPPEINPPPGANPYDYYYARPRYNFFYYLTGFSFLAFAMGFSVCLFNIDQISQCVDYAEGWVDILVGVGQHIIDWFFALLREVIRRT